MALDISCAYFFEVTSATGANGMAAEEAGFALAFDLALLGSGHGFWSHVKSDGGDVRAAKVDGTTQLALHVVEIDKTGYKGLLLFNDTSTVAAKTWRIYYGNAGASQPAADSTYGSQNAYGGSACLLAMPLAGTPADYSASPITVASDTTDAETTTVKIGKSCRKFTRANSDKIDIGAPAKLDLTGSAAFTILSLAYQNSSVASGQYQTLFCKGDQQYNLMVRYFGSNQSPNFTVYDSSWRTSDLVGSLVGAWHSWCARNTASKNYIYCDKVAGGEASHGIISSARDDNNYIGENSSATGRCWDGWQQMLVVYNSDKGVNFIYSWHNMMMANNLFWPTIGAEVAVSGVGVKFPWQRNLKSGAMQAMAGGLQ
jgi:hypothetical protein